jgi:transketolase
MVEVYGKKATRYGFGEAVVTLGEKNPKIFVLGADTAGSVAIDGFQKKFPARFRNVGVAEQNLVGIAAGLSVAGFIPYACTYSVFATGRPWEQIRTTVCYSKLNVKIIGSHSGVMVGPDGATHQALEEIAIMRCLPNMKVIVPCDYIEAKKATAASAEIKGPLFIRLGRVAVPIITKEETPFEFGKAIVLRKGKDVAIMACGIMVYEALMAAEALEKMGISASVINIHTVKPIDSQAIINAAKECGAIVTAEEHQVMGGFGSAVSEVVAQNRPVPMEMVGVMDTFGESGEPEELVKYFHLKDTDIIAAVQKVLKRK